MHDLLARVLRPIDPPLAFERATDWWADHRAATRSLERPIDRAIAGAARVDRLGFAFAGGYAAALCAMVPELSADMPASLAATEEGGAHPRAIATTLAREGDAWVLRGHKKWVTIGAGGGTILVIARSTDATGERPSLRVARVDAGASGVTITALPNMPFVPEIAHASVALDGVRVEDAQLLPGDGYERYLKPFRTIEDLHVHAALLAWLSSIGARAPWPHAIRERALSMLVTARALSEGDPSAPEIHVALAGALASMRSLVLEIEPLWASVDEPTRTRWQRDRALLEIASKAREARRESAWRALESG
ncbi:MAG: acyl-CoA dehydrogenase family protein [Myxococcota bacterium]|nr:acyl-CoA dehydrogenase family protein [Myxococcota bacterium]